MPFSVGAGTEDVIAIVGEEEDPFSEGGTGMLAKEAVEAVVCNWKGQWLTLGGHLETVETAVTDTTTSPEAVRLELPLNMADIELPLAEVDGEVSAEKVGMDVTKAVEELELETLIDDAT